MSRPKSAKCLAILRLMPLEAPVLVSHLCPFVQAHNYSAVSSEFLILSLRKEFLLDSFWIADFASSYCFTF